MADAKQGKTEDFYNGSNQTRVVLAKPRLGGFGSSSLPSSSNKTNNPFGSVLRPPQLKPSLNPFLKVTIPDEIEESKNEKESNENRLKEEKPKEETEVPMFVPLGSANVSTRSSNPVTQPQGATSTSNASGFVFGQNLSERVMMQENVNNGEASSQHSSTNGSTELLFTNAAASVKENSQEGEVSGSSEGGETSLAASAAEYERTHARPPPPAANYSHTGEEDETNVLQTTCRLFAWESGSWRERGRGVLRLNDAADGSGGARLVVRVAGSLRVALNTKLWPDMVAERAGTKSLRITAADAQHQVKLYLIMGAPVDITQLHRALTSRIAVSKRTSTINQCTQNTTSQKAAERLEADYPDKTDETGEPEKYTDEQNDRLELPKHKTEEYESNVDGMVEDKDNPLKRKEPITDNTSPKRQRPEIVIE